MCGNFSHQLRGPRPSPAEDDEIGDLPASVQRRRPKNGLTIFPTFFNDSNLESTARRIFFSSGVEADCQSVWCSEWALGRHPCGWLWEDLLG